MKKAGLSIILFLTVFVLTYIGTGYFVPGWRIKLEADALTYFLKSLGALVPVKFAIALAAGLIAGVIPVLIQRLKSNTG